MTFQPTQEQNAIVAGGLAGENMLVVARAGAAKTSTLTLIAKAVAEKRPATKGLALAFNVSIKEELSARFPSQFEVQTISGCGYRAWSRFLGRKLKVESRKVYFLLKELVEGLPEVDKAEAWEFFSETMKAVSAAKNAGASLSLPPPFKPIMTMEDFFLSYDIDLSPLQQTLIEQTLKRSWEATRAGTIDFDDMVLAPAISPVSFDSYDLLLVDEAQDLSPINHVLLRKIVRGKTQIIAVGDPAQAIYGFRGADSSSMAKIAELFDTKEYRLTTTFRCGYTIVEEVKWRTPDINAPEWAKPGTVEYAGPWTTDNIPDNSAIICRNNAPLFRMAIRLLRKGRYPEMAKGDVVKGLTKIMEKFGKKSTDSETARVAAHAWAENERRRQRTAGLVDDQLACIELFLDEGKTLDDAIKFAEKLMESNGRIKLMTGHKSKGLEFDTVFFLDRDLCRRDRGQDANIEYVICTRAKSRLIYIKSEDYTG